MLSVVIPALDCAPALARLVAALDAAGVGDEVVVVDGGSTDGSAAIAGVRVIHAPRGRGPQLAAGAAAARGERLLFLHADSLPGAGFADAVARFTRADAAGVFRLMFDDEAPAARRLERIVAWRTRVLALPYGDQGLLIGRALYDFVGGFRPLPLMEDVDLVRRLGRRRVVALDGAIVTSAARYTNGYRRRSARNLCCLGLYFLGVPPRAIARLYG